MKPALACRSLPDESIMNGVLLAACLLAATPWLARAATHVVHVNEDGSFTPQRVEILSGDRVEWRFTNRQDTIIPINYGAAGNLCARYLPYNPADPNEFTGPMPKAASGFFALSPEESPYASQDATWQNTNLAGVFIRLRWDDVHLGTNRFDWTQLDQEIQKAVTHGKLYNLGFKAGRKGTPQWIFNATSNNAAVTALDFGFHEEDQPDTPIYLGSPADPIYRKHYFDLLTAAAAHLRQSNAWYRALATIKICGVNFDSHENRLPNDPEDLPVWAGEGNYRPTNLYQYYRAVTELLATNFPHKDMNYALIQGGFPQIDDLGIASSNDLPRGDPAKSATQTEFVLNEGRTNHGRRFLVAHNGLQPKPASCLDNEDGCPNPWVLEQGELGQVTGFQTVNYLTNVTLLESALSNAWENTDAIYLELYEGSVLQAGANPLPSGLTLGDWAERFHERRRTYWYEIPDPYPLMHRYRFTRTLTNSEPQLFYYINGSNCSTNYGVVAILSDPPPPMVRFVLIERQPSGVVRWILQVLEAGDLRLQYSTNLAEWISPPELHRIVEAGFLDLTEPGSTFPPSGPVFFRATFEN